jgi:Holliday junction resolvasome RuvABC endonuclease subunit
MTTFSEIDKGFLQQAIYLGIDQSLAKTGLAFENEAGMVLACILPPPATLKGTDRLAWLRDQYRMLVRLPKLRMIAIEGYSFGSKFQQSYLGELGGVLRMEIRDAKTPAVIASPMAVKKFLTGTGKGKKANMTKEVFKVYGLDVDDDNEADAIVLGQIARGADTKKYSTLARREVLDSLDILQPKSAPAPRVRTRAA